MTILEALQLEGCQSILNQYRVHDFPCGLGIEDKLAHEPATDSLYLLRQAHITHHYEHHNPRNNPWSLHMSVLQVGSERTIEKIWCTC